MIIWKKKGRDSVKMLLAAVLFLVLFIPLVWGLSPGVVLGNNGNMEEKAKAVVILSDLIHIYDGTMKYATATTIPEGLNVHITYAGGSSPPIGPGEYSLWAEVIDHTGTYQGSASATFIIYEEERREQSITVKIDEHPLKFDVPPIIIEGRTMVPLRAIFEALAIDVKYDAVTRSITGTTADTIIQLTVDSTRATVNNKEVILDAPATVMEGRTLVPVRFIAESTGQYVLWDAKTRTVFIY